MKVNRAQAAELEKLRDDRDGQLSELRAERNELRRRLRHHEDEIEALKAKFDAPARRPGAQSARRPS